MDKRYHVVRVNAFIGDYSGRHLAYAVADRERANIIISQKYRDHESAYRHAEGLNIAEAAHETKDNQ